MTTLRFEGGPLHGTTYALEKDQPLPTEYRRKDWSRGHYVLLGGRFVWRPSK